MSSPGYLRSYLLLVSYHGRMLQVHVASASRWPITIGPCLGEGTLSRLRLTGEPREW